MEEVGTGVTSLASKVRFFSYFHLFCVDFGYLSPSSHIQWGFLSECLQTSHIFLSHFQVSDLGKKGWSSLAGSNLSTPQGGFDANGSSNYQSSGLSNSDSYQTNKDWNNDT